jgi:hemerythrin superfamily protein
VSENPDRVDGIELLIRDHRTVDDLFEQYENLGPEDHANRRSLVDDMIRELSVHAAVEEQFLYPFIRDEVDGGDRLAQEGIEEHQEAKEILADLEDREPSDPDFDARVRELIADVRHHVEEEEQEFFPALRTVATPEQLGDLGERLSSAKSAAPTRPHPGAPNTPPGNLAAGPVAGAVDRAKDAVTKDR